jgi:hypothetical protein
MIQNKDIHIFHQSQHNQNSYNQNQKERFISIQLCK